MRRDIANPFASRAPIALRSSPKTRGSADRTVRLEETFALQPQLLDLMLVHVFQADLTVNDMESPVQTPAVQALLDNEVAPLATQ